MRIFKFDSQHFSDCTALLKRELKVKNTLQIPKISKVTLNMSSKEVLADSKVLNRMYEDLFLIAGQKPIIVKAKSSIAGFKLRKNMQIGVKVTLRRKMMFNFLKKLINIALPRVRDFRGFSAKQLDGHGNFSFGVKEQIIFPEIDFNNIDKIRGLDISVVTTATSNLEGKILLTALGFPFFS